MKVFEKPLSQRWCRLPADEGFDAIYIYAFKGATLVAVEVLQGLSGSKIGPRGVYKFYIIYAFKGATLVAVEVLHRLSGSKIGPRGAQDRVAS